MHIGIAGVCVCCWKGCGDSRHDDKSSRLCIYVIVVSGAIPTLTVLPDDDGNDDDDCIRHYR